MILLGGVRDEWMETLNPIVSKDISKCTNKEIKDI